MDTPKLRPKLTTFRVLAFNAKNELPGAIQREVTFEITPTIELALGLPSEAEGLFDAVVNIQLKGCAVLKNDSEHVLAEFAAAYEARFVYPPGATEAEIAARFESEAHQYMLVAQVHPLAASHFRRELMAMGFNVGSMPLGI